MALQGAGRLHAARPEPLHRANWQGSKASPTIEEVAQPRNQRSHSGLGRKRSLFQRAARADFGEWALLDSWTTEEAIALSFQLNPKIVNLGSLQHVPMTSPKRQEYQRRLDQAKRAINAGKLHAPSTPADFVKWASKVGIELNQEFKEVLASESLNDTKSKPKNKSAEVKSDNTAYRILAAMACKHLNIDLFSKRTPMITDDNAKNIEEILLGFNINSPQFKTIKRHIEQAISYVREKERAQIKNN